MVAQVHKSRLKSLKSKVEGWNTYFNKNNKRYEEFMKFVFSTALTNDDIDKLKILGKPTIEFNVLEAYISHLRGQFSNQTPSLNIRPSDAMTSEQITMDYLRQIDVLEGYLREIILSPKNDGLQNKIWCDCLAGGYSVVEVYTEYTNSMSFDQDIKVDRVFDPTMTGFDPLARASHKGDGQYCFQLYPRTKDEFVEEYGEEYASKMSFARNSGFSWSYSNQDEPIVLICDFFEKVRKKTKIVKLSNGSIIAKKHYQDLLEMWDARGFIEQPPVIIKERMSEIETIVRYKFCESEMLDYVETSFDMLPLIFIDGNSVDIKEDASGAATQMTRPYVFNAKGIQKLKNYSGQTVGCEIENMVQHKFKVSIESIPSDYQEAYKNVQQADVLIYNAFKDGDPSVPLPPPMEIQRTATPQIVESTFMCTDRSTEIILGSYNSTLATNEMQVSGKAIANGSIHTSAASTPYLDSYINGLNRIADVVLSLIPKYYVTARTLPIRTFDGKRAYQVINDKNDNESIDIKYRPHELNVEVEAGVNNSIQKAQALELIARMMESSEVFSEFINTMGLEIIVDNMDIRGSDGLKALAAQFMKQKAEAQEEAAQKPDPQTEVIQTMQEIEQAKIDQKREANEGEMAVQAAKVALEKQKVDAQVAEVMNDIETKNAKLMMEQEKVDAENARTAIESAMDLTEQFLGNRQAENENKEDENQ